MHLKVKIRSGNVILQLNTTVNIGCVVPPRVIFCLRWLMIVHYFPANVIRLVHRMHSRRQIQSGSSYYATIIRTDVTAAGTQQTFQGKSRSIEAPSLSANIEFEPQHAGELDEGMDGECDNNTMIYFPTEFDREASSSTAPLYEAFFRGLNDDVFFIPTDPALRVRKKRIMIRK